MSTTSCILEGINESKVKINSFLGDTKNDVVAFARILVLVISNNIS
jgi:hypothetical protein